MAHYVAKMLKLRPNEILDGWGVPELIVAYGQYANEESYNNFLQWKNLSSKDQKSVKKPDECHVKFYAPEEGE